MVGVGAAGGDGGLALAGGVGHIRRYTSTIRASKHRPAITLRARSSRPSTFHTAPSTHHTAETSGCRNGEEPGLALAGPGGSQHGIDGTELASEVAWTIACETGHATRQAAASTSRIQVLIRRTHSRGPLRYTQPCSRARIPTFTLTGRGSSSECQGRVRWTDCALLSSRSVTSCTTGVAR